jgi:hypothetical protein
MSDQEMHFADPDWRPPRQRAHTRRQASKAPRASPASQSAQQVDDTDEVVIGNQAQQDKVGAGQSAYASYEDGYRASTAPGGNVSQATRQQRSEEEQATQQARRRRNPWFWSALALLLIILLISPIGEDSLLVIPRVVLLIVAFSAAITFLAFIIQRGKPDSGKHIGEIHSFTVGTQPKVIVKDDVGAIRIHPGSEDRQVIVMATRHSFGLLGSTASAAVHYEQNDQKNRVTIKARTGWHFLGKTSVDFDVTVPSTSDLDLKTEAGGITVSGVSGQMICASDAGSVKVTRAMLRGDSRLKTDAGSITFSGSLHPNGTYTMTTDAGNVTVTLPEETAFRVDAKTDVGSINSDFPLVVQRDFPGAKSRGDIGMAMSYPMLKLRTDVGSINLRQG